MWSGPWLCGKCVMLLASASSANHATASALWSVRHAALPPVLACLPHGELWWLPLLHQQMVPGKALLFFMAAIIATGTIAQPTQTFWAEGHTVPIWLPQLCNVPLLSCLTDLPQLAASHVFGIGLHFVRFRNITSLLLCLRCTALPLPCTSPNLISIGV